MSTLIFLKEHLKWLKKNYRFETKLGLTKLAKHSRKDIKKTERQIKEHSK